MQSERNISEIERAISKKRELMIASAKQYGFTNEKTLKHSQELDELINEYNRFFSFTMNREVIFLDSSIMNTITRETTLYA